MKDTLSAYDTLMAHQRTTEALASVAGRTGWDQETMMPRGSAPQRADEMAALEEVLHARRTDPRIGEWLDAADPMDEVQTANLREIRRNYERTLKVPGDLAAEIARVTSLAQGKWARARENEDADAFIPVLAEVVRLRREEGAALAEGGDPYDALMQDYEPGGHASAMAAMFDEMRSRLVDLRRRALDGEPAPRLSGTFPKETQLMLAREIAEAFGYDFQRGRLDLAVHPFSSGSGLDVRITTRVDEADPFNCLYSTIHEVGHAAYEQNVDAAHLLTPLGRGVSMGVHESQSRSYENQMGRSEAYCGWLYGRMRDLFGEIGVASERDFYRAVNAVRSGYIRTEADEVNYNLHIMLRFDLERALIRGELEADGIEAAWNERFEADFGFAVDRPSNGFLQDVHWSVGLMGYFPTYSLGNLYAGCLMAAARQELSGIDAALAKGDPSPATTWMCDCLQRFGGLRPPVETIENATGSPPSAGPLLDYLEAKFGDLYP
ncbi:carboxypeptidase M32 [Jannaschia aquimarina]|uniref:Metal-dependent carboxypeptidase n=1 Tax=Jannaschia aquimarina TaxID=935700 RepID=A0A0D1D7S5_9RHOB|nr:carboxypeptidase M32 [Jannaschia aquimarina]KIT16023.1 Thermostable carboxypeptidase 1 [Jannaschia aquimarina]SNT00307.1 carboxypeptidase Taq Metallo peptidase. MEROPS family M32 [Jannaschia aquimarina]